MRGYNPADNPNVIIDYINPHTNELLMIRISRPFVDRTVEALEGQGCRVAVFAPLFRPTSRERIRQHLER